MMRGRCGFTLMEVLLALFILSLLAAIAAPSFSRTLVSGRIRVCTAEVRATMARARSYAVTGGQVRVVVFHLEEGKFGLDTDEVLRVFPEPIRFGAVKVRGEEIRGEAARVRFYPDGTAEEAEVVITSGDGVALRVKTDPLTGIVEAGLR